MKVIQFFGIIILTANLSSCATGGGAVIDVDAALVELTGQDGRACIMQADINAVGVLQPDIISIEAKNNHYLATTIAGCMDLQESMHAYFNRHYYQLCGGRMVRMVKRDGQCVINKIYLFENRGAALAVYNGLHNKGEVVTKSETD